MANGNLTAAKAAKNDEFYTMFEDVEAEIKHYKEHFKGKVVLCNCDNPKASSFFKYFSLQFEHLGLKKLISTHYNMDGSPSTAIVVDSKGSEVIELQGNGDFRSDECVEFLKEVDIVVTNPPFSLFREFVALMTEHNKKFLIIGSQNAITYKDCFKLIKCNEMWLGINLCKEFIQPDGTTKKFGNIGWFTNLEHHKRNEVMILGASVKYTDYPKYDNYDAIEVSKTKDIPEDYNGVMGVPITFLTKYNPEQFEILGMDDHMVDWRGRGPEINGVTKYRRIIIRKRG